MGGETEALFAIARGVYWLLTAPYEAIQPVIDRLLYYALLIIVVYWLWKKVRGK